MKLFLLTFTALVSLTAFATKQEDIIKCVGEDRYRRHVEVLFHYYVIENQNSLADVQIKIGNKTKSYKGLSPYYDNEGGFDYGVTGNDFMFHVVNPPNWIGKNKIGGQLYYGKRYQSPKAYLQCVKL